MPKKIVLNKEELDELKMLIDRGKTQSEIAFHFQVTDDTIRRICRENGIEVRMPHKCTCCICGDTFYSNIKNAKTCSKEHHQICSVCGQDFIVDRSNIKSTCSAECSSIARYGTKHPLASDEVKAKRRASIKEKYGVSNVSQLPDHNEKTKQTCLAKYGAESYAGSEIGRAAIRQTNLNKFGCEEPLADPKYRSKLFRINLAKYGTEHPMQLDDVKAKYKDTMLEYYGVDNPMKDAELLERQRQSVFNNHGVMSPMQIPEVKDKMIERSKEKYGVPWPIMLPENRKLTSHSKINQRFEELLTNKGLVFESEFTLQNYIFDDKCGNVLIEIDPTYTHNSCKSPFPDCDPMRSTYHRDKSKVAENNGYRCIHVFDWDNWSHIIQLVMKRQLYYARKCNVYEITKKVAEQFTSENHIQGSCYGQELCYGLFFENTLLQVMTFGKPRYNNKFDYELLRLCSKVGVEVVGGASKLFKYFIRSNSSKSVISYCDAAKFSGQVYLQMGMRYSHSTEPAKVWSKGNQKVTDNLLRQRGYDQLFKTNYGKGTSNEQLMLENGWLPVYDCGQKVFVYNGKQDLQ